MPRHKGSKNKATIERELMAAREIEAEAAARVRGQTPIKKLGKEVLEDFTNLYAGMAAYYQPYPASSGRTNPNADEKKFREYSMLAVQTAAALAPFQSPRLSAVAVGAAIVSKVEVVGGMPNDFAPPVPAKSGEVIEFKPGTVLTPDDFDKVGPKDGSAVA